MRPACRSLEAEARFVDMDAPPGALHAPTAQALALLAAYLR